MRKDFKAVFDALLGCKKLNIYQRVLQLSLLGSLLTSVIMGGLYIYAIFTINDTLHNRTAELSKLGAEYMKSEMDEQIRRRMLETVQIRAQLINRELEQAIEDVRLLSDFVSLNLKTPELHLPHTLPNALYEDVHSGTPYIFFTPALVMQGIDEKISREIGIASACEDLLWAMSAEYDCIVVASKNGYIIRIDDLPNKDDIVPLCSEPLKSSLDSRQRDWYKLGEKVSEPTFTNLYTSTSGFPCVSVVMPYFDNDGFAGVICLDINPKEIYDQVSASTLKEQDTIFVLDREGEVLFSTIDEEDLSPFLNCDLRNNNDPTLAKVAQHMVRGEQDIAAIEFDGLKCYIAFAPMKSIGWSFGTLVDANKIFSPSQKVKDGVRGYIREYTNALESFVFKISACALFVVTLILAGLFQRSLKEADNFVKPINSLIEGVREVAGGNLDKKIDIKTGDEIELLANNFNQMTVELSALMKNLAAKTAADEHAKTELAVATKIQDGMLPKNFPTRAEFNLYASMVPAKAVGGDFYDFYFLDKEHLVITIADVSDKGVPAALFMVMAKTLLKDNILTNGNSENLSAVMYDTNNELCANNEANMFVTMFTAIIKLSTGEMTYVNAGHNPPFVRHNKKFFMLEKAHSPIFGTIPGLNFSATKIHLAKDDAIFMYTDGVTEAMTKDKELFSEKRLQIVLDKISIDDDANKILSAVNVAVKDFVGDAQQSDDITMLAFIFRG